MGLTHQLPISAIDIVVLTVHDWSGGVERRFAAPEAVDVA